MFSHIKELIVVMTLACTIFVLARPICLRFMEASDFTRRRNLWLALTAVAFLSPSFWLFAGASAFGTLWVSRRDSNPIALFVLLFAIIPNLAWYIPFPGINQLFDLSQGRLLAIVLLIPIGVSLRGRSNGQGTGRAWIDACLVGYLLLQLVLPAPYETGTNTMRRAVLLALDFFVVYHVFSRALDRREKIVDAMATFVLIASIAAAIGVFESFRGWLMYEQIGLGWGAPPYLGMFLYRAGALRAQASFGHSLTYGYAMAMALTLWLHLRTHLDTKSARWLPTLLLVAGVYVSHSRGPWLTALAAYFFYLLLSPGGVAAFVKGVVATAVLAAGLAFTPMGERVIATLPFIGTVEQGTIGERQRLAEVSWRLIWENPVLGDPLVLNRMEELKAGQGFVDLMNGYAAIALFSGFAGLALFAGFFFGALASAHVARRIVRHADADLCSLGAALVAAMLGSAIFIATASVDWIEYVLVGMAVAYATLVRRQAPAWSQAQTYAGSARLRTGMTS